MAHSTDGEFEVCASWAEAQERSSGYDDIKLTQALSKAGSLQQAAASPSVGTRQLEFLAVFMVVSHRLQGRGLRVLDFGGGNGNAFVSTERLVGDVISQWTILETPACAEINRGTSLDSRLEWSSEVESELAQRWDLVLLSGALQYLDKPRDILRRCIAASRFVIVTRTPLVDTPNDVPAIQKPCGPGYSDVNSSIPVWFLSREGVADAVRDSAQLILSWETASESWEFGGSTIPLSGVLFERTTGKDDGA